MLVKEYRLAMPLTVEEYRIGQLYMIAKHSHEQSEKGEGVEVVTNEPVYHKVHGQVSLSCCSCLPNILTNRRRQWMLSLINPFTSNTCSSWASELLLLDVHDRPTF